MNSYHIERMYLSEEHRESQAPDSRVVGNQDRILHLLYHELTSGPVSNSYQMELETFRSHLGECVRHRSGPIEPVVTFDDGHSSNFDLAGPALEEFAVRAFFFITAGWISEYRGTSMSWNDLRTLQAAGHVIGAHGWSHKLFTHCTPAELHREIVDAKSALEDNLGVSVSKLSFPGGRSNQRAIQLALNAGYTTFYTSLPAVETRPLGRMVGRVNVRSGWSSSYLAQLLEEDQRAVDKLRRQSLLKDAAKKVLGDRMYSKLWTIVNGKEVEEESFRGTST